MSKEFYKIRKGLNFPGNTANPSDPQAGDLHYRTDLSQLMFYAGGSWQQVTLGASGAGGVSKIQLVDRTATTLPSGANYTADGVAVSNNNLVLFTNLSSGGNQVYKVTGVGTTLVWTLQTPFTGVAAPTNGDMVYVQLGTGYKNQILFFDGTNWDILSRDFKVFTAGEAIAADTLAYISVGSANGDTGNNAGMAYTYSAFSPYKSQPLGYVKFAVTSGQQVLIQATGVYTFASNVAATTDYGRTAWAYTPTTFLTNATSPQRRNSTNTAHAWGLYETSLGTVLSANQISLSVKSTLVPSFVKLVSISTSNTAIDVDSTNMVPVTSFTDGLYAIFEYTVLQTAVAGSATVIQTGRVTAWKGNGSNWDYTHVFSSHNDLGFRMSVTTAGVIQYVAPTATITSISLLKIHSINNRG